MKNFNLILHSSLFLGKDYVFLSESGTVLLCNNLYLYSLSKLDFVRKKKAESGNSFLFSLGFHSPFRYLYPIRGDFLSSSLVQSVRFKNLKLLFRSIKSYLPLTILGVYPGGILVYSFGSLSFMPRFSLYCYWFFLSRFFKRFLKVSRRLKKKVWRRVKNKVSGRVKNLGFRRSILFSTQSPSHFCFPYFSLFSLYEGKSLRYQDFFSTFSYNRILSSRLREEVEAFQRKDCHPNFSLLEFLLHKGILSLKEADLLAKLKISEASEYRLVLKYIKLKLCSKRTRRVRNS
jgi:hypothetical protein